MDYILLGLARDGDLGFSPPLLKCFGRLGFCVGPLLGFSRALSVGGR